jgi:hypothetical protein
MGRGVLVPKFGLLTFTAPEVKLEGVTNPHKRDQQPRMPVFIISKEFAASRNIESGIIGVDGSVRPYKVLLFYFNRLRPVEQMALSARQK